MRPNRRDESRDATTVFVSLALCLIVLFAYLNATALPSQALLSRAVARSTEILPTAETREVGIPEELGPAVAYYRSKGRSAGRPGEIESSLLIDRRGFEEPNQSGLNQDRLSALFKWISAKYSSHNIIAELTCFITADANSDNLGELLTNRARQCQALDIFNGSNIPTQFSARQLSSEIDKIRESKGIAMHNLLLVTLRRVDGRR